MPSSGGVFSETLQSITTTKLNELSKKRTIFEQRRDALLSSVENETDQMAKLRKLVDGVKKCFDVRVNPAGRIIDPPVNDAKLVIILKNIERFLEQARYDPSISPKLLQDWEQSLLQQLNIQSLKYQYASLYGQLVTEWLSEDQASDTVSDVPEGYEEVSRKENIERDESRAEWEKVVFEPFETDQMAISAYLRSLFGKDGTNKQALKALDSLRKDVQAHEISLGANAPFNSTTLKYTIKGLFSSDLLTDEKRGVLKDFLSNDVILTEVADVLNMRMAALDTWSWETDVEIEQRRNVNGNYHIYMHEDLLQAIFLQYIGVTWSVFFKRIFNNYANYEEAWASPRKPISKFDKKRREYFLGSQSKKPSVASKRQGIYRSIYFMSQLMDNPWENNYAQEGEEEADYEPPRKRARQMAQMPMQTARTSTGGRAPRMQLASKAARKSAPSHETETETEYDEEDPTTKPKSRMEKKQFLLHLLSTEIHVNTCLHGEFTCTRAEFESWGPCLPHSTIYAVLSFFGVSNRWLRFFRRFLEAPLKFQQDGVSGKSRNRKRGVPQSHVLSEVFGEVILFALDYSVNQATEGGQLHRIGDDFWIWSSSHQTVVKAWSVITAFADIMGVAINPAKTGTVRISKDRQSIAIDKSLPSGEIRWGFLVLDPRSGQFVIDQKMVDKHIDELESQLTSKHAIFSWIQAWNTYAGTFFTSNFGKAANCFGRAHVDQILSTLERIQRRVFSDGSSVVQYLKSTIEDRFGISNIPDGFLYFTTDLGGLALQNPFIEFLQIRDAVPETPSKILDEDFTTDEVECYRRAKSDFDLGLVERYSLDDPDFKPADNKDFFSFEEFTAYREEFESVSDDSLLACYEELLHRPDQESVNASASDLQAILRLGKLGIQGGIAGDWNSMLPYWRWIVLLYGSDMVQLFGGLDIVDKGLLPIGMVGLVRSGRVKWQG